MHGDRDVKSDRAVEPVRGVVPTPILQLFASVGKAHEPLGIQAFGPEFSIERDEGTGIDTVDLPPPTEHEPVAGRFSQP